MKNTEFTQQKFFTIKDIILPEEIGFISELVESLDTLTQETFEDLINEIQQNQKKIPDFPQFLLKCTAYSFSIRCFKKNLYLQLILELQNRKITDQKLDLHYAKRKIQQLADLLVFESYYTKEEKASAYYTQTKGSSKLSILNPFHDQPLEYNIKYDNLEEVQNILAKRPYTSIEEILLIIPNNDYIEHPRAVLSFNDEYSVLEFSAFYGAVKCFKYFFMNFPDNSLININDLSKLAVAGGNIEIVHICEQNGIDFSSQLKKAIEFHHNDIVDWILTQYGEIDHSLSYSYCCKVFNFPAALFFFENREFYSFDHPNISPLHYAAEINCFPIAKFFVDFEDVNNVSMETFNSSKLVSPLLTACYSNSLPIARLYVEKGADVNKEDWTQFTPLHYACLHRNIDMINLLLEKGADINSKSSSDLTCFDIAVIHNTSRSYLEFLLSKGAKVDLSDDQKYQPIHFAAINDSIECIQLCLELGFSVNTSNFDCMTPLLCACKKGSFEAAKFLIENGADLSLNEEKTTQAFLFACRSGSDAIMKMILDRLPSIDIHWNNDYALIEACTSGSVKSISLLIEKGANYNYFTKNHISTENVLSSVLSSENQEAIKLVFDEFQPQN